ncbi:MAG: hypothetical protein HKN74_00735 [Acidimicrobiia bacterium]|nr:hypothetical protein [Acidimicrobiia bacterium]MBT8217803.1 hypothetical protein [Acidimicrobiia bacterium]NNF08795.1 hypothetical protein [Acidimicrobiia bacterium]NNL71152.1 hypothetical protein [Acidimicrobiia bacterium]
MAAAFLPPLPDNFEPTRATLHAYANAVGSILRAHAVAHPKWWHVSLKITPHGLITDNMSLPESGIVNLTMDLINHEVVVRSTGGDERRVSMREGLTGTQMGERLIEIAAALGLEGSYSREKFENDDPREYAPEAAAIWFEAAANVSHLFNHHLQTLEGTVSQVQLWPHNFDLACEWFGTRVETHEENGEVAHHPSQINVGFYPAGRAYFYSNPWPFEADVLTKHDLPHGAEWHTDGWEGSILYYDQIAGDPEAANELLDYARAVHDIASPTLMA